MFISIEGPDGAGKSSVLKMLYPRLKEVTNVEIILTREPGGSRIAELIRQIILDPQNEEMDSRTEALLYAASRRQHLIEKIVPTLNDGKIILCDRFVDSSIAYQGSGRKIGIESVASINQFAIDDIMPDLTLYLDIEPEIGLKRIAKNRQFTDRMEEESLEFHRRVREGYLKVLENNKERIYRIDASRPVDDVLEECFSLITNRYPEAFPLK